jgi:NADH-quinone oxidoreductase subunit B
MGLEESLGDNVVTTQLDKVVRWCRRNSLWPLPFATACCGIELMATASARYDLARFGAEVMRFSPRQSDLLIVAGRVVMKMLPVLQRIYLQMTEPKWVISMGACCSSGGVFNTYSVVQGIDQFLPVDVYVPGCPPRPETLIEGVMSIQRKIDEGKIDFEKRIRERKGLGIDLTSLTPIQPEPASERLIRLELLGSGPAVRTGHTPTPPAVPKA